MFPINLSSLLPLVGMLEGRLKHLKTLIKVGFDIAVTCEALPVPGKYRSGCLQSAIGWNTRPPMKELEKVPKELKASVTL